MHSSNYPSNYRAVMESNVPSQGGPVQAMPPVQCTCRHILQQQFQYQHHQQQQQQQQPVFKPQQQPMQQQQQQQSQTLTQTQQQQYFLQQFDEQDQLSTNACCNAISSFMANGNAMRGGIPRQYEAMTGDSVVHRCPPLEITFSSVTATPKDNVDSRLQCTCSPFCQSMHMSGKSKVQNSDDEYYSLSSGSSDRDDQIVPVAKRPNRFYSAENSRSSQQRRSCNDHRTRNMDTSSLTHSRNAAILNLLQEVVHLINQDDDSSNYCGIAQTKMRNIGTLNSEESIAENGPFNSGFKITFTPSRKGTSSTAHTEPSDASPLTQCVNIPLQLPCNLIITPSHLTCQPCPPMPPLPSTQPCGVCALPPESVGHPTSKVHDTQVMGNFEHQGCIGDLELIEEIASLALKADPQNDMTELSQGNNKFPAGTMAAEESNCNKLCPQECSCSQQCGCPVHGMYEPVAPVVTESTGTADDKHAPTKECEGECDCDGKGNANDDANRTDPANDGQAASTDKCNPEGNADEHGCNCCHCRAVRNHTPCMTIATPEQALENNSPGCTELKYFIDSIIMDLDAMEHARRRKQIEQDMSPPKARICPRQSYPVTISEVNDLGLSSLYVKWTIHNCTGIAGYEIYVDGYLTNRYFHCNHEAAVVCDVDVMKPHKIVLVAQPKPNDSIDKICDCISKANKCKELLRKSDAEKMDKLQGPPPVSPSSLWTPSVFMYDPAEHREMPAINRDAGCT